MTVSLALFERRVEIRRDLASSEALLRRFLQQRSPRTRQGYQESLRDFARFLGPHLVLLDVLPLSALGEGLTIEQACDVLLSQDAPTANTLVLDYILAMQTRQGVSDDPRVVGLSPNTVNSRLYALRALCKLARTTGRIEWAIEVDPDKRRRTYRDTRGPGRDGVRGLFDVAQRHKDPRVRARDAALIALGYDLALRRGEVLALDRAHLDLHAGELSILGKGRAEPELLTLPLPTRETLATWVRARGDGPGALVCSFNHRRSSEQFPRLSARGLAYIIKRLGKVLGIRANYHGLRHAAITDALDATGGDIRAVMRFSRHRDPRTLEIYDDRRQDHGAKIAQLVAERARHGDDGPPASADPDEQ